MHRRPKNQDAVIGVLLGIHRAVTPAFFLVNQGDGPSP